MLGSIYEVPVQLGMYHIFILSEYTFCCVVCVCVVSGSHANDNDRESFE